jgi:hypothetical protein
MRTTVTIILAAVLGIGSTACSKDKKEEKPAAGSGSATAMGSDTAGSGSAAMAGSGSADTAGSAAMAGSGSADMAGSATAAGSAAATPTEPEMLKKAGNCPSMVFGAVTKADVKGKDVVLTITSEDKDAVASIQKRTESLLKEKKEKKDAAKSAGHDQKGAHGGGDGLCPVYWSEGSTAKMKKDAKGVTVTITPKEKPEELKAMLDERISKAAAWVDKNISPGAEGNKGAVGGGKGAHGSTHQGAGDSKGKERKGSGGGAGTGGGGGKGTGGGGDMKKGS